MKYFWNNLLAKATQKMPTLRSISTSNGDVKAEKEKDASQQVDKKDRNYMGRKTDLGEEPDITLSVKSIDKDKCEEVSSPDDFASEFDMNKPDFMTEINFTCSQENYFKDKRQEAIFEPKDLFQDCSLIPDIFIDLLPYRIHYDEIPFKRSPICKIVNCVFASHPYLQRFDTLCSHLKLNTLVLKWILPENQDITPKEVTKWILQLCDKESWRNMVQPAIEVCLNPKNVLVKKTFKEKNNPWTKMLKAFLRSPNLEFSRTDEMLYNSIGLGQIVNLWKEDRVQ